MLTVLSTACLLIGWWALFANVFGDTSALTSSQVALRVLCAVACIFVGFGICGFQVMQILGLLAP